MSESDRSFAFVSGVPGGSLAGQRWADSPMDVVLEGIAVLAGWRLTADFSATVHAATPLESHEYELHARPRAQSYLLRDKASGAVDSYTWPSATYTSAGEAVALEPNTIIFEPLPVRLAFPMSLGVWGRSFDSWRIVSGRREPGEIILGLRHLKDVHLDGTLTIDLDRRLAVRLDTPMEYCHYENVEPLTGP